MGDADMEQITRLMLITSAASLVKRKNINELQNKSLENNNVISRVIVDDSNTNVIGVISD